jgi:hypothetical protein
MNPVIPDTVRVPNGMDQARIDSLQETSRRHHNWRTDDCHTISLGKAIHNFFESPRVQNLRGL